jgi:pimeloyl-ACP methyl ester carboxylesterase
MHDKTVKHFFYLHGFASSEKSAKAKWLIDRLQPHDVTLHCPDLNAPDFSTLTVSRMIDRVGRSIQALPAGSVSLIGSSLGAFVALHLAATDSQGSLKSARQAIDSSPIERLVLLAPAFDFGKNQMPGLDAGEFDRWQQSGHLQVFHHAFGEMRPVHYELYSDASRYDSFAVQVNKPIMIFQGKHDDVVDPKVVARFAAERSNVQVHWLDDGHQLLNSLEFIWSELTTFLNIES